MHIFTDNCFQGRRIIFPCWLISHCLTTVEGVDNSCAVLGYYAANSGNLLLTFRDNLSVHSSRVSLKMGPVGCPETSVRICHYTVPNRDLLTLEDRADKLSRNAGKELPLYGA